MLCSVPSPSGCLRAISEFLFLGTRGAAADETGCSEREPSDSSRAGSGNRCTQCAYSHSGFYTPYPPVGCTGGLNGSVVDDRVRRRNAGKRAVRACMWRAYACAQCLWRAQRACATPLPHGGARARSSARGQRDFAVCLTRSAASAFVVVVVICPSPL